MDLHSMLNRPDEGASKKQQPQPHPQPSLQTSPSVISIPIPNSNPNPAAPSTPARASPHPQSFRDYAHQTRASPSQRQHPHEYPSHTPSSANPNPYQSPTSYNPPTNAFAGRPPVPPLQPPGPHDPRSPGSASVSGPSPYRRTPTSSVSTVSGGYPFPSAQQPPASPVQRHQYGPLGASAGPGVVGPSAPAGAYSHSRDSYNNSHSHSPSQSQPQPQPQPQHQPQHQHQHGSVPYPHSQQPAQHLQQLPPQTPPVGTPGGSTQYLHQRSHSIQSSPTPTSAHSQSAPYGPPYIQGSPVATIHPHPLLIDQQQQQSQHQRQPSQPPTPLGQPVPPRLSPAVSYKQPPSPYQKRASTVSAAYPPQPLQTSPKPPLPAPIQRMSSSSSHGTYDAVAESHRGSQSRSERDRSVSVSPKTRVPSLPSSSGHRPSSISSDVNPYHPQRPPQAPIVHNTMESQHAGAPAKRKLEHRDLRPDELENDRKAPPPPQLNGHRAAAVNASAQPSASPMIPRRKRVKYDRPPIWAQNSRDPDQVKVTSRNFSLKHHIRHQTSPTGPVNGNNLPDAGGHAKPDHVSRHTSPEAARSAAAPRAEEPSHAATKDPFTFNGQPFPWEPSISNETPKNILCREVADFLGINVLQFPHLEEVHSRGAVFEIEAKLGVIIDKMTNDRIYFPEVRAGECVLDGNRVAFRSSMTESQHRELNEFLNEQVKASFPRNPTAASRVQVHYVHRREVDRFYELAPHMRQRVPACISGLLQQGAPIKARVTVHEQNPNNVIAKIVKARIADLNIHFPHLPLDCRISINLEWNWDGSAEEIERGQNPNKERPPDRIKDRLSYKHGFYQIDLTQVKQGPANANSGGQPGQAPVGSAKEHELEVELDARSLIEHGRMLMQRKPNRYEDLVDGLVNNVRVLARRCPPPHYHSQS
ncbi:mRNA triphosphatase CET1 [Daldinia caldariorum]|uniref:mRNA triphosphatase CET1 n=1 Tax=Daldinia caldariorum TaxID=326644 RepID=UPI0020074D10|nr:mRNA triphosphatase CET1 [Daldinia caldariorum]KAI1463254.1 mRNA triphosphatase CET1 [Daldinia caldariorum]